MKVEVEEQEMSRAVNQQCKPTRRDSGKETV